MSEGTIRWGILGCGDVARRRVAGAIAGDPHSSLLAACRRNGEALEQFCGDFGVERGYTDENDLIGDSDIDAVYIATPVDRHLPQTLACAAAGKHVLCEKPMAMSVEECDRMIAACADAGVTFIGPSPRAIALMGNKRLAKLRMAEAEVPCVPGYSGTAQDDPTLAAEGEKIGFPLMVTAAAGGGGRGMRLVEAAADLPAAISGARSEAENAFGSG